MDNGSLSLSFEGQVEVFYNGVWGGICADGWDLNDAKVVCRQLGFPDAVKAWIGNGTSLAHLTNVQCNGSEEHLRVECPFSGVEANQNCSHGVAGVVCQGILMTADKTLPSHFQYNSNSCSTCQLVHMCLNSNMINACIQCKLQMWSYVLVLMLCW